MTAGSLLEQRDIREKAPFSTANHRVRTHLNRLLPKTGFSRQSDLVRLLMRCALPFEPAPHRQASPITRSIGTLRFMADY